MIIRSSLIISILFFLIYCNGDITSYSDNSNIIIYPDAVLDINGDGTSDVWIRCLFEYNPPAPSDPYQFFEVLPLHATQILYDSNSGGPDIYQRGDTIMSEVNSPQYWWHNPAYFAWKRLPDTTHWAGPWAGKRGYLPLKIKIGEEYHCAWINMKVDTLEKNFKVYRTSYNIKPNANYIITN